MKPKIILFVAGLFILFVISIPFIEVTGNSKYLEPYPEIKPDTVRWEEKVKEIKRNEKT